MPEQGALYRALSRHVIISLLLLYRPEYRHRLPARLLLLCAAGVSQQPLHHPVYKPGWLWDELAGGGCLPLEQTLRIGTGNSATAWPWSTSLIFIPAIFSFLSARRNALLELKTKTTRIEPLLGRDYGEKIMVSWSLNARSAQSEEHGAAPVEARIRVAGRLAAEGYRIGFHFDPLILFPGWSRAIRESLK